MGQYTSYWMYQRFEQRGSQDPIPVYPNTYSIDGDGTMPPVVRKDDDEQCGYIPPIEPIYRWTNIPITQDYICDDCSITPPYEEQYFTIVPRENGAIRYTSNDYYYSMDSGSTWSKGRGVLDLQLTTGNKVMLKGSKTGRFQTVYSFDVEGNIMSLVFGDNFVGKTDLSGKGNGVFNGLFYNLSGLVNAGNLILPATVLIGGCYTAMFQKCTSLTTVPVLPATTLADECYFQMFDGCTSLTTAPALPAITLASKCYFGMFYGCTSLTTAPVLPATTLVYWCYRWMFRDCTSLNYIKCLATDTSAEECTDWWVMNVPSGGTFVTPSSTNWSSGDSGIPTGWTRVNI